MHEAFADRCSLQNPSSVTHPASCICARPIDEAFPYCFIISTLSKEMVLAAASEEERRRWLDQLRCASRHGGWSDLVDDTVLSRHRHVCMYHFWVHVHVQNGRKQMDPNQHTSA